ncbi:serum amyloid P-component-like [Protobothrops mucrosquamatus]|uniref:serum amyloid P-component-like n=1 Tax=Protobothrops mucrosquamatus TaxID=103944 RepID=UPI000775F2D5|nr:serum amyloid P-component-like [Protobothrops mucrosquamatus]
MAKKDLEEQFFLFPKRSISSYVLLKPHESREMASLTLCLRFYSELKQDFSLFSAASRDHHNEILIFKGATQYDISLGNQAVVFQLPEEKGSGLGEDLCVTWDSATGIIQLWLNRIPLPRKVVAKGYRIRRDLVIMLGQDQDSYGGSLDTEQAFEGELGEVYLWDSVLSAAQLRSFQRQEESTPLLDWSNLSYEIKGDVMVVPSSL